MNKSISETAIRKVPEITVFFWILKLMTTAMGETTSDFLVHVMNPIVAVVIGGACLITALIIQFSVKKYNAWSYWFAAAMVAVFGTMAADVLHIGLGIPYLVSTIFFSVALIIIFVVWYAIEKTLSIHSIDSRRRELFYWATVMTTFALGTAVGDMTAITLNLGYLTSGIMFAVFISLPALAYWKLKLNGILAFWLAYILTRPFGASFADWAGKPQSFSGLGLGTGWVSVVLTIMIISLIAFLSIKQKEAEKSRFV